MPACGFHSERTTVRRTWIPSSKSRRAWWSVCARSPTVVHSSSADRRCGEERSVNQQEQFRLKVGLAEMLKGGVIMDVSTSDQAEIAQESGAAAVMALERIPALIRRDGGVARMSDPAMVRRIQSAVDIPVMAKCRIGHIAEAQILEALEIDFIDESEVLTPADEQHHIEKHSFKVPFV